MKRWRAGSHYATLIVAAVALGLLLDALLAVRLTLGGHFMGWHDGQRHDIATFVPVLVIAGYIWWRTR